MPAESDGNERSERWCAMSFEPTRPLPNTWQAERGAPGRRRRRRWPIVTLIVVILLVILAVAADRVAVAVAENKMASQIENAGFPAKPHVTIEGFPFLTQLAKKDFNEVVISASNVTEGPLEIASVNATLHGMHLINGFTGARIDTINGSALITFGALASAGGVPQGITLTAGSSPDQINANIDILGFDTTVTAQLRRVSADQFNVRVVSAGDIPTSVLGNLVNFTTTVPKLPAGMSIQSVNVTQRGVMITITGQNTTLSQ
jgi:LmeA-like phospholipid-binding